MIRDQVPIPPDARAVLTISLAALRANWGALNRISGRAECAGVIKANAYGLGLPQITRALIAEGCKTFFVATLAEARIVREAQPGVTIYVLDGLLPGAAAYYAGFDLRPCLSSLDEIREWAAYGDATGRRLRAAVHLDTGMNRLGLTHAEALQLAGPERALFQHFDLALVMSHLACADEPSNPMNGAQRTRFDAIRSMLPAAPASLANSGGTFLGPDYHYDLVRPGIALYGGRALEGRAQSHALGRAPPGPDSPSARGRRGRSHRLWRYISDGTPVPDRNAGLWLCRRLLAGLERADRKARTRGVPGG